MSPLVYLVMFGWMPFVLYLFGRTSTQRALVISFVAAWLFLPEAEFPLLGLPDYTKMSATCYGVILATILYDVGRFQTFQFGWLDVPMLVWCICPFVSSVTNGLGVYDGFANSLTVVVNWGIPYFLGRIYLGNLEGLKKLAIGIFIGGLAYVPLCLYESKMSPQLHRIFYGFSARTDWAQNIRYGGWRPTVFMEHGLMVGVWMMMATLTGIWLWQTGIIKRLWNIQMKWLVAALFVTTILVRSTGAWLLLAVGIAILFSVKWFRTPLLMVALISYISLYLYTGATGTYNSQQVVSVLSTVINEERISSFEFRVRNEAILSEKARQQPIFGWGGHGRNRVEATVEGERAAVTDSLWIIAFGQKGTVGLVSLFAALLLPVVAFTMAYPARLWTHPKVAPAAVLAVGLTLYVFDCVLNAMVNPIFTLTCGGIAGLVLNQGNVNKATVARARSSPPNKLRFS
jgi:hypothetical protein